MGAGQRGGRGPGTPARPQAPLRPGTPTGAPPLLGLSSASVLGSPAAAAAWKLAWAGGSEPRGAVPCTSTSTAVSAPSAMR